MPSRRQAIIWTNDGKFTDAYMRHSASINNKLIWLLRLHDTIQIKSNYAWIHLKKS